MLNTNTIKQGVLACSLLLGLTGCSAFTQDNYTNGFKPMYEAHVLHDSQRMAEQAGAIVLVSNSAEFSTPVEAALYRVIAVQAIRDIQPRAFTIKSPITGYDVLDSLAGGLPMAILGFTSYGIAKKGFQYNQGTNVNAETMTVNDSFNRVDTSVIGDSNTATSTGRSTTDSHDETN